MDSMTKQVPCRRTMSHSALPGCSTSTSPGNSLWEEMARTHPSHTRGTTRHTLGFDCDELLLCYLDRCKRLASRVDEMQALQGSANLLGKMWRHCRHWLENAMLRAIGVEPPEEFESSAAENGSSNPHHLE
ncbi:MAG: hypothetical protein FRX49_02118 [Trebouxia sp. A1-2]|nr:MAG: hypothetical protein FRX49_02118 [Trebouxia sp. A1-2]